MKPRLSRTAARRAPLARLAILVLLALATAFSTACSPPAPTQHAGHGVAVDVDPTARTVTLEHGDIPGLMKAMTMTFPVASEVDLAAVGKGETVDFEVQSQGSTVTVTAIRKASAPEPQPALEPQPAPETEAAPAP